MRYLMLVCLNTAPLEDGQPAGPGPAQRQEPEPVGPWVEEMNGRGIRLMGHELRPVAEATSVRMRGGEVLVSDGPFAETKEVIAGFDLLECGSLAEAIEVASRHPVAKFGRLELRRFADE